MSRILILPPLKHGLFPLALLGLIAACSDIKTPPNDTNTAQPTKPAIGQTQMTTLLISKTSSSNFEDTKARLRAGIEKRPLKLFAEVDHAKGAASIDIDITPSTLFIFGNPKGGSPLMKRNPKMGIALPLKMHIYEANGEVVISYQDILAIGESYGLDKTQQPLPNIAAMLDGLAQEAAGSAN